MEGIKNNESIEKIKPKGIIAGGPAVGKTEFVRMFGSDLKVKDIDSGAYIEDKASWPQNYITDIIENIAAFDLLLISTVPEVVRALRDAGFEVTAVCPDEDLVDEYRTRLEGRGHSKEDVEKLLKNGVRPREENQANFAGGRLIFLKKGEYLSHLIEMEG